MKENGLLVNKKRYKVQRKPKASYPNQIWGRDMTKIKIGIWGCYYLVVALDWYIKEIIGYHLSLPSKSKEWQVALEEAVSKCLPRGIKDSLMEPLFIVSDNGFKPTSLYYMKACSDLGIKQIIAC